MLLTMIMIMIMMISGTCSEESRKQICLPYFNDDFKKALLKSASHTIKFTHLKCAFPWFEYIYRVVPHYQLQSIFIIHKRNPLFNSNHFPLQPHPSPRQPPLIYFLPLQACYLYKQNHTICGLLQLASFIQHHAFKVHPCCSIDQYFIYFYCQIFFHCMETHFMYSLSS